MEHRINEYTQTFIEPKTIAEAYDRINYIQLDIRTIQMQLSEKREEKTDENGVCLSFQEFSKWRRKAKFALLSKEFEHAMLKSWIKNGSGVQIEKADNVEKFVFYLLKIIKRISSSGIAKPTPDEYVIIDTAREWIRSKGYDLE